jgi:hypothetical protein
MIDKLIAYFLFFTFLFFVLFNLKISLLHKKEYNIQEKNQIEIELFLINNSAIYQCYEVIEKNGFDLFKSDDNFNPKINGYSILTENLICNFKHNGSFKTEINYSLSEN